MNFPPEFQFTQGNLQTFMDCRRRFYLGAIRRLTWPAIASEPLLENERYSRQGAVFHRMIQQYFSGIPSEMISPQSGEEVPHAWMEHFMEACEALPGIREDGARQLPELNLTYQLDGFRLTAKYDLLVIRPDGRLVIYDWKTSRAKARRNQLAERMQTRLYRYLLMKVGYRMTGIVIDAEQVSMVYWFANHPDKPEGFPYSIAQFEKDAEFLHQTITLIKQLVADDSPKKPGEGFPLTTNEKRCAFCIYRSLCARGVEAGVLIEEASEYELLLEDGPELSEISLNLDQIAEIEF